METKIFVDTSAFVALFDKKDKYHQRATDYFMSLQFGAVQLHTSNYIIDETITRIRIKNGHKFALEFGKYFFMSKIFQIHYIDKEIEQDAFEIFKKYSDKKLSFTDSTSFALMKKVNIKKAFTFDTDFKKAGFEISN